MSRYFSNEYVIIENKHIKRSSTSLAIKEIQRKITISYYFTPTKMVKIK